jgi:hypothetical protein
MVCKSILIRFVGIFWGNKKRSLITSFIALAISLSFLIFKEVMVDEAGNMAKISQYKIGYWLWVSSSLIMVINNMFLLYQKKKETTSV